MASKALTASDLKALANTPITQLRGRRRQVKAIARAITWTDAYMGGLTTAQRYQMAAQLYVEGVRVQPTAWAYTNKVRHADG